MRINSLDMRTVHRKALHLFPNEPDKFTGYIQGYVEAYYDLLHLPKESFFETLATKLRELWPAGEKDGKYPWRDSVTNIAKRLEFLWEDRDFQDKYTLEQCLQAARRYLAQFEDNTKYMQILKYFIFKQDKMSNTSGKTTYTYKSTFADMLEGQSSLELQEGWEQAFDSPLDQGDLI